MEIPVSEAGANVALVDEESLLDLTQETLGFPGIQLDVVADLYLVPAEEHETGTALELSWPQDHEQFGGTAPGSRRLRGLRLIGYTAGVASLVTLAAACSSSASSSPASASPKPAATSFAPTPKGTATTTPRVSVTPGSPNSPAPQPVEAMCTNSALQVELGGTSGTAGGNYVTLKFKNIGLTACWLDGYPGVSAWNGGQIGEAAARNPAIQPSVVTLGPGSIATSYVKITDPGVYSPKECDPTQATDLKVYPPDFVNYQLVPDTFTGCAGNVPLLHVEAVEASTTG